MSETILFSVISKTISRHLMNSISYHSRRRSRGQAMVEFALILPVLLMVLMVLIEGARLFSAWLILENVVREAARYAVTGQFDPAHCAFPGDDTTPADTSGNCDAAQTQEKSVREAWEEYARLFSIYDVGNAATAGMSVDFVAGRNTSGYFQLVVCSTREGFTYDDITAGYPRCVNTDGTEQNDAGGPNNRVFIVGVFDHPIITPLRAVTEWVPLIARREMINEAYRTGRLRGLPDQGGFPTPTPTNTGTPTATGTETQTP